MIDLHSHVLPGVDDGPRDLDGSREILAAARADGITHIAATPHVRQDYPTTPEHMETALAEVRALDSGVEVLPGGELDLWQLRQLDDAALRRFGLAGNPSLLLVETPYHGWPLELHDVLFDLAVRGYTVLLAHPERNSEVHAEPELVRPLVEAGAYVQLTAASVDGRLGRRSAATAKALLDAELAHVLASDAHSPAIRQIGLGDAVRALGDAVLGEWLTHGVPAALVAGEDPPARPPGKRRRRFF